jgi:hypothetical protein
VPTEPAQRLRIRFPDGPHDAETLLVHPETGDLYVLTKEATPAVYVARAPLDPGVVTTLERVGTVAIGTASAVTGGDIAPDGRRVALCTYADGYELELPAGESRFDAVWNVPPRRVALGLRAQGEAIAYRLDGNALLTTSERGPARVVPLQQVERRQR